MSDIKTTLVITRLVERELTEREKSLLVQDLRRSVTTIDTSVIEAYYDVVDGLKNSVDLRIIGAEGRYYFHIPTGWILTLHTTPLMTDFIRKGKCKKLYFKSFISVVFDKITKNRTEIDENKISESKGLKKLGYRMIFCLSKNNEKSILLAIVRHISVLSAQNLTNNIHTKTALAKAKQISHNVGMVYPNVYYLDRIFKNLALKNELLFYKKLKKVLDVYNKILYIP